jgi:hypothetical protein
MNLLLLLSALLSALTGAGGYARAAEPAAAVAGIGAQAAQVRQAPARTERPIAAAATIRDVAQESAPVVPTVAKAPAWLIRRRE